jgi:hypothetical protein
LKKIDHVGVEQMNDYKGIRTSYLIYHPKQYAQEATYPEIRKLFDARLDQAMKISELYYSEMINQQPTFTESVKKEIQKLLVQIDKTAEKKDSKLAIYEIESLAEYLFDDKYNVGLPYFSEIESRAMEIRADDSLGLPKITVPIRR